MGVNNTYVDSRVSNSAVGAGATNLSNNVNSFNTTTPIMHPEQKEAMFDVIEQALEQTSTTKQQLALLQTKNAIEQSSEHFPRVGNQQDDGLLQAIWEGIKNVDAFASAAERAEKYIAPTVALVATYLSKI